MMEPQIMSEIIVESSDGSTVETFNMLENASRVSDDTPEGTPSESEETAKQPDAEAPKEEPPSEETEEVDETKPWKPRRKNTISHRIRGLTNENKELKAAIADLKNPKPASKPFDINDVNPDDFPDQKSMIKHIAEELSKGQMSKVKDEVKKDLQNEQSQAATQEASIKHFDDTKKDIPDLEEILEGADRSITLPKDVVEHLDKSPVGWYVRARIADDVEISEQLKTATPAQKKQIVGDLHDELVDYKIAQIKAAQGDNPAPAGTPPATPPSQPATPPVAPQKKAPKAPPKAPPKVKTGVRVNMSELTGDDYARAYNKKKMGH